MVSLFLSLSLVKYLIWLLLFLSFSSFALYEWRKSFFNLNAVQFECEAMVSLLFFLWSLCVSFLCSHFEFVVIARYVFF